MVRNRLEGLRALTPDSDSATDASTIRVKI